MSRGLARAHPNWIYSTRPHSRILYPRQSSRFLLRRHMALADMFSLDHKGAACQCRFNARPSLFPELIMRLTAHSPSFTTYMRAPAVITPDSPQL